MELQFLDLNCSLCLCLYVYVLYVSQAVKRVNDTYA